VGGETARGARGRGKAEESRGRERPRGEGASPPLCRRSSTLTAPFRALRLRPSDASMARSVEMPGWRPFLSSEDQCGFQVSGKPLMRHTASCPQGNLLCVCWGRVGPREARRLKGSLSRRRASPRAARAAPLHK